MIDFARLTDGSVLNVPTGVHRIPSPVRIAGKRDIRVIGEDGAILRGTIPLRRADFTEESPGVFSASVPVPVDGFFIGARRYSMARYPKATDPSVPFAYCGSRKKRRCDCGAFGKSAGLFANHALTVIQIRSSGEIIPFCRRRLTACRLSSRFPVL